MEEYYMDMYFDLADKLTEIEAELSFLQEEHNQLLIQVENLPEEIYNKYIAEIE